MILGRLCLETMKLEALIEVIQSLRIRGPRGCEVRGIAYDSRSVRPGYLFAALKGEHFNGEDFVADAVERGAVAVLAESGCRVPEGVALVEVEDARRALAEMARAFYGDPAARMKVFGVTGTNGKTTTAFMLRAILAAGGDDVGLIGTIHYRIGARIIPAGRTTPEAPDLQAMMEQMLNAGCRSVVMEVSSHALDQDRVWGIDFDVGIFTNLTPEHLDYHGDMRGYFEAKARLFKDLGEQGKRATAVINLDDPWGQRLAELELRRVEEITYGTHPLAQVRAFDIRSDRRGMVFGIESPWWRGTVRLPLIGRFNVGNALAAFSAAVGTGTDPRTAVAALEEMQAVPGRLEEVPGAGGRRVFVDYAHSEDALQQALESLREICEGKLLVVFGCGGDRDAGKRPRMGAVARHLADYTVITSDNPRSEDPAQIAREIEEGFGAGGAHEIVLDRREAIARALDMAREGDIVVVAGKGHETYQEFADTVTSFDDREVVRSILEERKA